MTFINKTGSGRLHLAGVLAAVLLALVPGVGSGTEPPDAARLVETYTNPFGFSVADPFVLQENGTYYLYATTATSSGFEVFTSEDLVHWRLRGLCYEKTETSWGRTDFWAPEVVKKGETYYLYYTAKNPRAGIRNTCVAKAASPMGPFIDIKAPMFPQGSFIDAHVYLDDASGQRFIYATEEGRVPSTIFGAILSNSMTDVETSFTACLRPSQPWEDGWVEGPFIIERDGFYYMMYSGSAFWEPAYAVGYATAVHPLGPWTKSQDNPILRNRPGVDGPGHNSVALSPDGSELFMVYHRHATFWNPRRELAIDRIQFEPSTTGPARMLVPSAPTATPQKRPSGSPRRFVGTTDEFSSGSLDFSRWITVAEQRDSWRITSDSLVIATDSDNFFRTRSSGGNLFLQAAPAGDFTAGASVRIRARRNNEQAVVTVWQDQDNYIMLTTGFYDGPGFATIHERHGKNNMFVYPNEMGDEVQLRIARRGDSYTFSVSADGEKWEAVGPEIRSNLNPVSAGLGASGAGGDQSVEALFSRFELEPAQ